MNRSRENIKEKEINIISIDKGDARCKKEGLLKWKM